MEGHTTVPAIALHGVEFQWPKRAGFRLAVPDFVVEAGERVLLLGESGSGKSTLLSLISGIITPGHGSITISGTDLARLSGGARDRFRANRIGVIFQQFNLLPYASPLENILLGLRFAPDRRARVDSPREDALRLAGALGLPEALVVRSLASELSVGQQQRVAVARALIGRPALIVADEPTSALDASAQGAFLDLLFEQVAVAGSTLLMVSHDERLGARFDRLIRLGVDVSVREEGAS